MAIWTAAKDVKEGRTIPVPRNLRDAHYGGAARLGHGEGYKYAHDYPGGYVDQSYLGVDKTYYEPTDRGYESTIREYLGRIRQHSDQPSPKTDSPEP
jgi:putative ATPase